MITAILKFLMTILLWILRLVEGVFNIFRYLAGTEQVTIKSPNGSTENSTLIDYFLGTDTITKIFYALFIISIFIIMVSVIVAVVKSIVSREHGEKKPHGKTVGQGVGSIFITLSMAAIMLIGISVSNTVLQYVDKSFNEGKDLTISQSIIDMSVQGAYEVDYANMHVLPDISRISPQPKPLEDIDESHVPENAYKADNGIWYDITPSLGAWLFSGNNVWYDRRPPDGAFYDDGKGTWYEKLIYKETNSGWLNGKTANDIDVFYDDGGTVFGKFETGALGIFETDKVMPGEGKIGLHNFNFLLGYFGAILLFFVLCSTCLGLVKRMYDLVLLFLSLPLISGTIPLNDGAYFKLWRETVISKVILVYGAVIAVNVFLIFMPLLNSIDFASLGTNGNVLKMFIIVGGGLSINGGQILFARLFGTSAEESREMTQSLRALTGGIRGTAAMALGARGADGKRYGGMLGAAKRVTAPVTSRAKNAGGGLLFGGAYKSNEGLRAMLRGATGAGQSWADGGGKRGLYVSQYNKKKSENTGKNGGKKK